MPLVRAPGNGGGTGGLVIVESEFLRPALELAFVVAVVGARQRPPVAPPAGLRPFVRFQKLPTAALGPVRRALDDDEGFRRRVADVATEELVGRLGWLWLRRPDGWEDEFDAVVADERQADEAENAERLERAAHKRLDGAEQAARRAAAEAVAARSELEAERIAHQASASVLAELQNWRLGVEDELAGLRRRAAKAEERASASDATAAQLGVELASTQAARAELAADLQEMAGRGDDPTAVSDAAPVISLADATIEAPRVPDVGGVDIAVIGSALQRAAAATEALGAALAEAGQALLTPSAAAVGSASLVSRSPRHTAKIRRNALRLPGGVMADSVDAAVHLVGVAHATIMVDGYNVAKLGWPDQPLSEQRERLLDVLEELVARHGTSVHVVFDGADIGAVPSIRRRLRVTFSAAGVSADDVIGEMVAALPIEQPVVIVTNDRAVRDHARRYGANLLTSQQLLAVSRRLAS